MNDFLFSAGSYALRRESELSRARTHAAGSVLSLHQLLCISQATPNGQFVQRGPCAEETCAVSTAFSEHQHQNIIRALIMDH